MKRRAVIILHPDFDLPGAAGIEAAQDFINEAKKGNAQIIEHMPAGGASTDERNKIAGWLTSLEYLIRKHET